VTVPDAVPEPGEATVTVAVSVTDCPYTDGFGELATVVVVEALFTVWVEGSDVVLMKFVSPAYWTVRSCEPSARADVLRLAEPPESDARPSDVVPSKNSTLPVGVPAPGEAAATVAVIVTDWPTTEGFGELATDAVADAWFTTWALIDDVLPVKSLLPAYTAVRSCEPTDSADVLIVAEPPDSVAEPSDVAPS
jgi:hypothetical protein